MTETIEWQTRGAIQVAQPSAAELAPTPRVVDVHELIACPTCRARVDEVCRTASGHTTTPHGSRLAPVLCRCGELLEPRHKFCPPCRRRRDQDSKNESARLRRAARAAAWA